MTDTQESSETLESKEMGKPITELLHMVSVSETRTHGNFKVLALAMTPRKGKDEKLFYNGVIFGLIRFVRELADEVCEQKKR